MTDRAQHARYNKTEKGRARNHRYNRTFKRRKAQKETNQAKRETATRMEIITLAKGART